MADFDEPKGFAFGDLNPVSEPRTAKRFDSKHTSALGAIREVVVGHYTPDALASTGPYKGVVLRVEEDMDQNNPAPGNWLATVFGGTGMFSFLTVPKKLKQYKVRIPELHSTLPIPDKFASSPTEVGTHQKIIDMYPTFVAKDSNVAQASHGDLVWVDFGHKGNMDDPTFLGPVFPPPEAGGGGGSGAGAGSASDAFNCSGGALGGGGMGPAPSGGSLTPEQRATSTHSTMSEIPGHQEPGNTHSLRDTENAQTHWSFNPDTEPTPSDWDIVNFTPQDLKSEGNNICAQNKDTLRRLDMCAGRAEQMGHPALLLTNMVRPDRNGGYRDPAFNRRSGGSARSRHQFGDGYDIWCKEFTDEQRINMLYNLYAAGFRGFGHGRNNIHADTGRKRQWNYGGYTIPKFRDFDGRHLPSPAEVTPSTPPAETPAETTPAASGTTSPQITAENITQDDALAVALTDEEKKEVKAATNTAATAATVAGKRAIEQSANRQSTPAQQSTSAQPANSTPQQTNPPQNNCASGGSGGGGSSGRGAQNIAHLATGESVGGVPFVGSTAADPFARMGLIEVPMDKIPSDRDGNPWYVSKAKVREDVAPNVSEVKRILNELGCVMPSSGSSRRLNASVGPGRIATSFHYTSAAIDLLLPVMMSRLDVDNWLVEFDPDRQGKFIVWARSGFTSGSVSKAGQTFEVEHKTLQAIKARRGSAPSIEPTTAYVVNVTKIMWAHGLKDIGGRDSWYRDSTGASEAWHFDFRENMGLVRGTTRFEEVLLTMHERSNDPPWASGHKTWSGGSFSSDVRLKTSITHIGTSPAGIPTYTFVYRGDKAKTRYHGVMAQDIIKTHPQAVTIDANGYYKVNYNLIDVNFHAV